MFYQYANIIIDFILSFKLYMMRQTTTIIIFLDKTTNILGTYQKSKSTKADNTKYRVWSILYGIEIRQDLGQDKIKVSTDLLQHIAHRLIKFRIADVDCSANTSKSLLYTVYIV